MIVRRSEHADNPQNRIENTGELFFILHCYKLNEDT